MQFPNVALAALGRASLRHLLAAGAFASWLVPLAAAAQIPGPVIDCPPTTIGSAQFIASFTTLNVNYGCEVGISFDAGDPFAPNTDVVVYIVGGTMGQNFNANSGSDVFLFYGSIQGFFSANAGSHVRIQGGTVADRMSANGDAQVDVTFGSVGDLSDMNDQSTLNLSGGSIGDFFDVRDQAVVNLSGSGSIGDLALAASGTTLNITGGSLGGGFLASGSTVNISGGQIGPDFVATAGSEVHLVGTAFILDGVALEELPANEPVTITDRNVLLFTQFEGGGGFNYGLRSTGDPFGGGDYLDSAALLTVTRLPEPAGSAMLIAGILALGCLKRLHRK